VKSIRNVLSLLAIVIVSHIFIIQTQDPFGNTAGDQHMLEYTKAGDGARLSMLVLHDDSKREYAYGPAEGLPDSKIGTLSQALYDKAQKDGWTVISMKNDWKKIFSFEQRVTG
jgi:hypothetical protein